jgi:hypothetical protein
MAPWYYSPASDSESDSDSGTAANSSQPPLRNSRFPFPTRVHAREGHSDRRIYHSDDGSEESESPSADADRYGGRSGGRAHGEYGGYGGYTHAGPARNRARDDPPMGSGVMRGGPEPMPWDAPRMGARPGPPGPRPETPDYGIGRREMGPRSESPEYGMRRIEMGPRSESPDYGIGRIEMGSRPESPDYGIGRREMGPRPGHSGFGMPPGGMGFFLVGPMDGVMVRERFPGGRDGPSGRGPMGMGGPPPPGRNPYGARPSRDPRGEGGDF